MRRIGYARINKWLVQCQQLNKTVDKNPLFAMLVFEPPVAAMAGEPRSCLTQMAFCCLHPNETNIRRIVYAYQINGVFGLHLPFSYPGSRAFRGNGRQRLERRI